MPKIFHLQIKSDNSHNYYGGISVLHFDNPNIGVSKSTLYKHNWTKPFENNICVIRKSNVRLSKRKTRAVKIRVGGEFKYAH